MQTGCRRTWQRTIHHTAAGVACAALAITAAPAAVAQCVGDCNGDSAVAVDEIITMVSISLEIAPISSCTAGDPGNDGVITVAEIIQAVNNALDVCDTSPARCGNRRVQADEECDDGGTCVGGPNAGTSCGAESDCQGNGICEGGTAIARNCAGDEDCPGGTCVHCKTFGGDGCASNCTDETSIPYNLVAGWIAPPPNSLEIVRGTSGAVMHGDPLTVPLPIVGSQVVVAGKPRNGISPFVIPAASVDFPAIRISTGACACVGGVAYKTCGGTLFETDGANQTPNCTPDFPSQTTCPADRPCAFVHGSGNSASGEMACGEGAIGFPGIDVTSTQDAGGPDAEAGPVMITTSGSGPPGSVRLLNSISVGTLFGSCFGRDAEYGPDGMYCTTDDEATARGTPQTVPFTTGRACSTVFNATVSRGHDKEMLDIGPFCAEGVPISCPNLLASPPMLSGLTIAGAFPVLEQFALDFSVTDVFVAQ